MKPGHTLVNKYRLAQKIGEGAMGEVWAGENLLTGGKVALKLIISSGARHSTPELRQRLLREARACGKLTHRNIVRIYDVGETPEGDPFLVLELLRGRTLAERLKDTRRIEPLLAARIGAEIANALATAHTAKIIHRDLKPANIFLHHEEGAPDEQFVVKVLDFGVSKNLDGNTDGPATVTNVAVGSPVYMSPEQITMQKDLDGRTDIWSFGVVLYEMLTGSRPFVGTVDDVVRQIVMTRVNKVPAPSTKVRDVSPEFDAIVARCLENDRAHRYADAAEISRALATVADTPMRVTGRPSRPSSTEPPAATATNGTDRLPATAPLPSAASRRETQPLPNVHGAKGPTGTNVLSPLQPVASPAPTWRKEMAAWRAQREAALATRAGEALQGGTQAIDAGDIVAALHEKAPAGTTSAIGSMSQPAFVPTDVAAPNEPRGDKRKRDAQILFGMVGVGLGLAVVMLVVMVRKAGEVRNEVVTPEHVPSAIASEVVVAPALPVPDGMRSNDPVAAPPSAAVVEQAVPVQTAPTATVAVPAVVAPVVTPPPIRQPYKPTKPRETAAPVIERVCTTNENGTRTCTSKKPDPPKPVRMFN